MKFCFATTFYPPYHFGGDAAYVHRLAGALGRGGHTVDVVHDLDAYHLQRRGEPAIDYPPQPNVTVHRLQSPFGFLSPLATHQTGRSWLKGPLRALLEDGHHDVVHFHNSSLIGWGAFGLGRGVKLYTMHEHWLVCPMHILWKFGRERCESRACIRCSLAGGRPPQWWRYTPGFRRSLGRIDRFIAPSRFVADKHREFGLDLPTTVLPYFIPTPPDPPEDDPSPHDRPYFLFVGRLVDIKGLQTVLPLMRGHPDVDLLVAGDGEYAGALRVQASGMPNVRFLGGQPFDRLRALYRHALAVIVPSICYEVFPMVVLEAFSEGTPAIVRAVGGLPEMIESSQAGMAYERDDELSAAMRRMRNEPELRRTLGERARLAHRSLWSEEPHMRAYFEVIARARGSAGS